MYSELNRLQPNINSMKETETYNEIDYQIIETRLNNNLKPII